jgi:tetratricopeptide (TPR) repeat protein
MDLLNSLLIGSKLYEIANIYRDCQDFERAVDYYDRAASLLVDVRANLRACFHYDRAIAYDLALHSEEATKEFELARNLFKEFMLLEPNDPTLPGLRILFEQVKEQLTLRENVDIKSNDYQASITARRWPDSKFPLKVCVETSFDSETREMIWHGFEEWVSSSKKLRCDLVSDSRKADIVVMRTVDSSQLPLNAGGRTIYDDDSSGDAVRCLRKATILLYRPFDDTRDLSPAQLNDFKSLVLHEAGHALGIDGHSPNGADLMYWKARWLRLSNRDRNTMRLIYECT